ncbi:MAG: Eco57I restriction-modification methylase domain-containing protein, partial [Crocinitomicaceae bacterium]
MALFQQSVLKKHIETLNNAVISQKWEKFQAHFLNATIQQNIRKSKEEQYQEGFLRDLFVNIFGYILNPTEHFNLTTELKNITNSKKVDGAIVIDGKAIGVIELKGTDTTDLAKIEAQAFGYKTNQPGCNYVITSNFEKLRFYIDNTTQYQEFNLFTLTKDEFTVLYCCLDWESISNNLPTNLLNQSVSKENAITKQLYNDYSAFKRGLYNNLVELNPQHDKLLLFKKTQKLLDRFLFIFFAEDRLLLPTNLIRRINKEWENLQKMRIPVSLYDRYVMYFHDLNEGAKVTLPAFGKKTGEAIEETHEIFAYNGGLFKNDEFLDNLKINDQLLYEHTHKLSDYDFQSEVDVNILGHIFENSLNEIDEIKSEIEGNAVDKTKTKRKKDGVFYTPKYITKYIVDNTVGKLCTEKKEELQLIEEEYHTEKNLQTKTKKALLDKLSTYREWLLQLTICDPACGSGAFLNQALEFLIEEHTYIDELQAKLMGDSLVLSDVENSILENNLYGVDLNDESIEIAKLSLWLRTAQKGRKLNSLNNNIKCGNSLIDDPEVAGDKAFSWEKEFPEVFMRGGFDVIIGNPPYVRMQNIDLKSRAYFSASYSTAFQNYDLYVLFTEKTKALLNKLGTASFIMPKKFITSEYGEKIKCFIYDN